MHDERRAQNHQKARPRVLVPAPCDHRFSSHPSFSPTAFESGQVRSARAQWLPPGANGESPRGQNFRPRSPPANRPRTYEPRACSTSRSIEKRPQKTRQNGVRRSTSPSDGGGGLSTRETCISRHGNISDQLVSPHNVCMGWRLGNLAKGSRIR